MTTISSLSYLKDKWRHIGFQKYFRNTGWVFVGKVFTLLLSLFLFSYIARYLGPSNLGKLSYAQSFVSLFAVFSSFGIDHVLYRDLVKHKSRRDELIGSSIFLKIALGLITIVASIAVAVISEKEQLIIIIIALMSLTNIFQPFTLPSLYFDSLQKSKINTLGTILVAILLSIIKILIIVFDRGIILFAAAFTLEAVFGSIYYLVAYSYLTNSVSKLKIKISTAKDLLTESAPLFLASISAIIYSRIDQIMLKYYLDSVAVGLYSVAVKIAEVWNFLPGIIIASLFPAIVNARISNTALYSNRLKKLLYVTLSISICFGLLISLTASFLIEFIAGKEYLLAEKALTIYTWGVVGMVMTNVIQQFLVIEGWTKITFYVTIIGAVINILLNIIFIPRYGINGAAYATLIAYWSVPFSLLLFPKIRNKILMVLPVK